MKAEIQIGSHTKLEFDNNYPNKIVSILPDSYSEDEFDIADIDNLILWLKKMREEMKNHFVWKTKQYSIEEAKELLNKLKDYFNEDDCAE